MQPFCSLLAVCFPGMFLVFVCCRFCSSFLVSIASSFTGELIFPFCRWWTVGCFQIFFPPCWYRPCFPECSFSVSQGTHTEELLPVRLLGHWAAHLLVRQCSLSSKAVVPVHTPISHSELISWLCILPVFDSVRSLKCLQEFLSWLSGSEPA